MATFIMAVAQILKDLRFVRGSSCVFISLSGYTRLTHTARFPQR